MTEKEIAKQKVKDKLKDHLKSALGLNITIAPNPDFQASERMAGGFKKKVKTDSKIFGILGAAIGKQVKQLSKIHDYSSNLDSPGNLQHIDGIGSVDTEKLSVPKIPIKRRGIVLTQSNSPRQTLDGKTGQSKE